MIAIAVFVVVVVAIAFLCVLDIEAQHAKEVARLSAQAADLHQELFEYRYGRRAHPSLAYQVGGGAFVGATTTSRLP